VTERGLIPLIITELRHLFHTLVIESSRHRADQLKCLFET
jgi:hypothetical protein